MKSSHSSAESGRVVFLISIFGGSNYYSAAELCVGSLLENTTFPVLVGCDRSADFRLEYPGRLQIVDLEAMNPGSRASGFLGKFQTALEAPIGEEVDICVLVDVDCLLTTALDEETIVSVLGQSDFAMVEQKTVSGSTMKRADFLHHFSEVALPVIDSNECISSLEHFRYWNSGICIARLGALRELARFALQRFYDHPDLFSRGGHLVADQDFFQYWGSIRKPGSVATLEPNWNNCAHWDDEFPMSNAYFLHWSNFCLGPDNATLEGIRLGSVRNSRPTACVVSHNSAEHIRNSISSAWNAGFERILVWDNASEDDSAGIAQSMGAEVIRSSKNIGFASAQNRLALIAQSEIICILNPDCSVSWRTRLAATAMFENTDLIAVTPHFRHRDGSAIEGVQPGITRLRLIYECWVPEGLSENSSYLCRLVLDKVSSCWIWPIAACLFMRRKAFLRMGGFSEDYFLYMEDVDFGFRSHHHNLEIASSGTYETHFVSEGARVSPEMRISHLVDARVNFARRHFGALTYFACSLSPWVRKRIL
jgi:GT2 family glycosyltransferase